MQYEVDIAGRVRHVSIARTGDAFALTLDGHTWQVDAVRTGAHALSLIVDNGVSYDVTIVQDPATRQPVVHVGSVPVPVLVNGRGRRGTRDGASGAAGGPQRIVAPMPGKIVRVLVAPGDRVAARQPVVVVEAMKMENELRAAREGTVAELHVHESASVDAGALLVVIQ